MQAWNQLINTAILGTFKMQPDSGLLPAPLSAALAAAPQPEPEELLLRQIAALSVYRRSGLLPLQEPVEMPMALPGTQSYCSFTAWKALHGILTEEHLPLLELWLSLCKTQNLLALPDAVAPLLEIAEENKHLQQLIVACCGNRGAWLCSLNPDWHFTGGANTEETWNTGTMPERKEYFRNLRSLHPDKARELLRSSWPSEDAAGKAVFLELMTENIGAADLPFLEGLQNEKGKKVTALVQALLKMIPESALVQDYEALVKMAVQRKKEKTLLGLMSKETIHLELPADLPEAIFKTGIEKVSSQKGVSDEDGILQQLLSHVPPQRLEAHLAMSPQEIAARLNKDERGKRFLAGIGIAAVRFRSASWARLFVRDNLYYFPELLPLLPQQEQYDYLQAHFREDPNGVIEYLKKHGKTEWPMPLAEQVVMHASRNFYQYNRTFFNQVAPYLPFGIDEKLKSYSPNDGYAASIWHNMSEYISQLIGMRRQTVAAFQS